MKNKFIAKARFSHVEQIFLYYLINIWKNKPDYRKVYPTLPDWSTCTCSYGKFSSHLGGILVKSSEIPPRQAASHPYQQPLIRKPHASEILPCCIYLGCTSPEMLLHFSQFEYSTQPRKKEGRRMSALTKIPLHRKKWSVFFAYEVKKECYVAHISFTPQEAEIGR